MYVLRISQNIPPQPVQEGDEWPIQPSKTQVAGMGRWLINRLVPPQPITDDEVTIPSQQFGLDDDFDASVLLRSIEQRLVPVGTLDDDELLFYVAADDDALQPSALLTSWQYKYPTAPILDDDPWTLFPAVDFDYEQLIVFPPMAFPVGTATLDDEVLANAVNIGIDEDYWSPIFTMMIVNVLQPVATLDDDTRVVFVPPPPSKAKGLPLVGVGS